MIGQIEMTVYESVAATLLAPLLARFAVEYPDLQLRTRQLDPDLAIESLAMGEIDLAFAIDYPHAPAPQRDDIVRVTILDDRFHAVVPAGDPLAGPTIELSELAGRPFIASAPNLSCGRCIVTACRDAGFEPDIVHQLDDYPTSLQLVAAGQGVSLVPDLGLARPPAGVRVLNLAAPLSRSIQLAYRQASAERPAIVAVREALLELAADAQYDAA